jgi:uncharacterized protein (TIGR03546 family)
MLKLLAKLLRVLNSDAEPGQISLALCLAMVAGLTPLMSLHNLLVLLLVLVLRANLSAFLLGLVVFTGIAYLLDPLFHQFGLAALTAGPLNGLWTSLYNIPLFRLENFNNSIVMGSLLFCLVLFVPLLLTTNLLIRKYREHLLRWVEKSRIMQFFKASKFFNIYQTLSGGGAS